MALGWSVWAMLMRRSDWGAEVVRGGPMDEGALSARAQDAPAKSQIRVAADFLIHSLFNRVFYAPGVKKPRWMRALPVLLQRPVRIRLASIFQIQCIPTECFL